MPLLAFFGAVLRAVTLSNCTIWSINIIMMVAAILCLTYDAISPFVLLASMPTKVIAQLDACAKLPGMSQAYYSTMSSTANIVRTMTDIEVQVVSAYKFLQNSH